MWLSRADRRCLAVAATLSALTCAFIAPAIATAAPPSPSSTTRPPTLLSATPDSAPAGQQITVSGSGFYAHETASLYWDGGTRVGKAPTSASGDFTTTITIPAGTTAGTHFLAVRGSRSFAGATANVTVTP